MPENENPEDVTEDQESEAEGGNDSGVVDEDHTESTDEPEGSADDTDDADTKDDRDDAPQWALKEIRSLRSESAARRTKVKELQAQLDAAPKADEVKTLREDNDKLIREVVAEKAGLPEALAKALVGTTREELEKHAAELQAFVPSRPRVLRGGLTPDDGGDGDVQAALAQHRANSGRI